MADSFPNEQGLPVVRAMIAVVHENRAYLSDLDGSIGDGDHGINLDKGFSLAENKLTRDDTSLTDALRILGKTLVMEIGGSIGPLYGKMFCDMAKASADAERIDTSILCQMLDAGYAAVREIGGAKPGDKTLVDTLAPACDAARKARESDAPLPEAVSQVIKAAEVGWRSTEPMVAKIGRSARLGERSRGVFDAGATSCYLLLKAMGSVMIDLAANADCPGTCP